MTTRDTIDRRALLATGVAAWSTVALGGCSDDANTGGTGGTGTGGAAGTGGVTGGTAGAGTGAAGAGGSAGSPAAGAAGSSLGGSGGTGGMGAAAGTGGAGPPTMCQAVVSQAGMPPHTHPLTIPGGDVDQGYPSVDHYILEDGGTGHTHTVVFTAYDMFYLQIGQTAVEESSTDLDHSHSCSATVTSG